MESKNPLMKYMSLMMKGMLKNQFDEGLSSIKQIAESMPKQPEPVSTTAPADTVAHQYVIGSRWIRGHQSRRGR